MNKSRSRGGEIKTFRTGRLTEAEFIHYCRDNERAFIDNYFYFAIEARRASLRSLSRAFESASSRDEKDAYLLVIAQEFLHFIEILEMVYYGFMHRDEHNTMLYHMFTHRCKPENFFKGTRDAERAYGLLNLKISNKAMEKRIHDALVKQLENIHVLSESLVDLWTYYNKLKHGFIVLGRKWNHRTDCAAIIGQRKIRNTTDHELRHIDLPHESIDSIRVNSRVIKNTIKELLAARKLELEARL